MNYINFNISTFIGPVILLFLVAACNSNPNRGIETKKEQEQIQRTATITLLTDSCAKKRTENAIRETRITHPEIGFNLYYSKVAVPANQIIDIELQHCHSDSLIVLEHGTSHPLTQKFIKNLKG